MAQEIELSMMAPTAQGIQPFLEQFEAEHNIRVHLRLLSWDEAWNTLVKSSIYQEGPDVSEIGSTWVGDLVGMNALRAFSAKEVESLGGSSAYLPMTWQAGREWAVPWVVGVRLLYYRRDLLKKGGIDEQSAFQSIEQLDRTLERLQSSGVAYPWVIPTDPTHTTLLNIASWVWGSGGDFLSPDGKRTLFCEVEALSGIRAYFNLGRFLAPDVRHLAGLEPDDWFIEHPDTAMTMSGAWLYNTAKESLSDKEIRNIGVTLPPGAPFLGGSYLVGWRYSRQVEASMKLIRFLSQPEVLVTCSRNAGLLPARLDALSAYPFASDPFWKVSVDGLKIGRPFPFVRLWGLVEDRLKTSLGGVWADYLAEGTPNLDAVLNQHLVMLSRRLDMMLSQS